MKKLKYIASVILVFSALSCAENFLDTKDLYEQSDENFYSNSEEITAALTAAYASIPLDAGNNNPFIVAELMSDDCFGGGGVNDNGFHGTDAFVEASDDYYLPLFETTYQGIMRVNMILNRFDQAEFTDPLERDQAHGEAYFLRAYFHFRLATFFGTVPLKTTPDPANLPKATPEELFGQIASDLKNAIDLIPDTRFDDISVERLGYATNWAAEALMARVFLFYTGYYQATELPLTEGGSITKSQVIAWVDDCIANSGHGLLSDFRNLWPYSWNTDALPSQYPYAIDNNLEWVGEDGANKETVFAIKYSINGGWNLPDKLSYSNQHVLYSGIRNQTRIPFGQGWGGGPANPQLWESFEAGDIRQQGSIINVNDPTLNEGPIMTDYVWGGDNMMHETGYWNKKYQPIVFSDGTKIPKSVFYLTYGGANDMQLWNMQDDILIRFADVLLMGAELGSANAQSYFDQVRARAGLASRPVNLENIKLERRHELAFEGLRYFDLLRWHDAESAFAVATNIPVKNMNVDEIYTVTYRPETGGFLPIPISQVLLSNGVLIQNPGW